jgi:1-phosphofructokinase family hexose kinase
VIVAAGLSPAWQRILEFERIEPGEVNRARSVTELASGKVLNVARALRGLGSPSMAVSPAGGRTGAAMKEDLRSAGVTMDWVDVATDTRVCTTLLERVGKVVTELVEESPPLSEAELASLRNAIVERLRTADVGVFTGSAPRGVPSDWWAGIIADSPGVRFVLDLRGPELVAALPCRPALVKPNREELEKTLGRSLADERDLLEGMRELLGRGAQAVLVTRGREPALLLDADGVRRFAPPVITPVNPIGSGDALTAGVARSLHLGLALHEAVAFGVACGAANAAELLPCRFGPADVETLMSR